MSIEVDILENVFFYGPGFCCLPNSKEQCHFSQVKILFQLGQLQGQLCQLSFGLPMAAQSERPERAAVKE